MHRLASDGGHLTRIMWTFQYKHGDRPLEGYTIQRAAGRGGFGEVYYAISDSGREVALKCITGYEQIELRGISQCMNLKSPHLVAIFDVKYNAQGRPFVIMEFVTGPSLRQLLDESPSGLGEQKAAFFLREIAKGLTFLHDCGIVHRDLKPGNIFYENGYVKIGDYGLSKAISTSQHSGQTITVGTVHYMAPEIGAGKYDRSIDIYALGAVLYEMLTGVPPYVGASPSEVLLKHLSATPDCTGISQPFATVIHKAMAKDPAQRYQSVQEMVEAVFGAEHVRQSMSVFSPEELSVVAARVTKDAIGSDAGAQRPPALPPHAAATLEADPWGRVAQRLDAAGERIANRIGQAGQRISARHQRPWGGAAASAEASRDFTIAVADPVTTRQRTLLGIITAAALAISAGALTPHSSADPAVAGIFVFVAILSAAAGLRIAARRIVPTLENESRRLRRLVVGCCAGISMIVVSGVLWAAADRNGNDPRVWIAMLAPLFLMDAEGWMRPDRPQRLRLSQAVAAAFIAFVLFAIFVGRGSSIMALAVAAGTVLAAQVFSPWRAEEEKPGDAARDRVSPPMPEHADISPPPPMSRDGEAPPTRAPTGAAPEGVAQAVYRGRPVPTAIRFIWLGAMALSLSLSVAFLVAAGMSSRHSDLPPFVAAGVGFGLFSILCIVRSFSVSFFGIWNYLIRPLLMIAAIVAGLSSALLMGIERLNAEETAVATFFIIFPAIVLVVLLFIPGKRYHGAAAAAKPVVPGVSPFKRLWALGLAAAIFGSVGGLHRFYVGKIGTGILWLMTGGLFFIGQLVDIIMIANGTFTDGQGRRLVFWEDPTEIARAGSGISPAPPAPTPTTPLAPPAASAADRPQPPSVEAHPAAATISSSQWNADGLFSALAGLFIFVAMLLALALNLDLAGAVAKGVVAPGLDREITQAFNGYQGWPPLVGQLVLAVMWIVLMIAVVAQIFARRRCGTWHIVAGLLGTAGLVGSAFILGPALSAHYVWIAIAPQLAAHQTAEAIETCRQYCRPLLLAVAATTFIIGIILIARPMHPAAKAERVV